MEDRFIVEDVRKRLVLAGLNELCEHGITDFSLRRVSVAAQVSCAAPYRHFKDKDELIGAIIEYIGSKWLLLSKEIRAAFLLDRKRLALELSVAAIRFWVANGNFRTVHFGRAVKVKFSKDTLFLKVKFHNHLTVCLCGCFSIRKF